MIEELIKTGIEENQKLVKEHNEVKEILKDLDGKPINGRTLNKKRLKGFGFVSEYGMYNIVGEERHLIGYSTNPYINVEKFEDFDTRNGKAAEERINQLKNMDVEKLKEITNKIENSFNELRFLFGDLEKEKLGSYHNPIYYDILRNIHNNKERNGGISLSDFHSILKNR